MIDVITGTIQTCRTEYWSTIPLQDPLTIVASGFAVALVFIAAGLWARWYQETKK